MWNKLLHKLSTMLQENSGGTSWSSTRFAFVFTVIVSNIVIFIALTILTIKELKFPEIPEGILVLYALANGIAFSGKVLQKPKEITNGQPTGKIDETKTDSIGNKAQEKEI